MFAIFKDLESFNTWHEGVKTKLNYPLYGKNLSTGEIDLINATTEYTSARTNKNDLRIIAWVGNENEGLDLIDPKDLEWSAWFQSEVLGVR